MLLFISGLALWRDKNKFGIEINLLLYKKKYYMMAVSLVLYVIGILIWIYLYHSDALIQATYLSIIPILLTTIFHFHVFFEKNVITSSSGELDNKEKSKLYQSLSLDTYKKMFVLPLILGILGAISLIIFPLYSTTVNTFKSNDYYNCTADPTKICDPTAFTGQFTQYFSVFNVGIGKWVVFMVIAIVLVAGVLIYFSFKITKETQSNAVLRIGMLLSTAGSFGSILAILSLYYYLISAQASAYPHVALYSLQPGIIIGIILFFISTAIALNINQTVYNVLNDQ